MTWVECKLETGRTHQIRAHLSTLVIRFLMTKDTKDIRF
jgi:23S rRNA-/tRNA-specific pseudouridylate synthase